MPKLIQPYLKDILEAIQRIEEYIHGFDRQKFIESNLVRDAVIRNLEIIGEVTKRIPPEITAMYPEVAWKAIAGFRDVLIHHYDRVDIDIVWDVIVSEIPGFKEAIFFD